MRSEHQNGIVTGNGALTEQALRASELSYRRLFEAAKDGILILDVDTGRISDVNPFLIKLLGLSQSEMVGKTIGELSPFNDIESNKVMLERLQKDSHVRYKDLPLETRDGRKIAVEFVSNVYQAGDKKVIQCNIRDITERKRAEEAMRTSERRFQMLADISPVGIFWTDARGQTTYVNPRWCQITGLSATDALGDRWLRAVHPEDREKLVQGWQAATQVHSTSKADYRFVHPDGTISWVMGRAVPEKDDAGRIVGYVGTIADITERKRAEIASTRLAAIVEFSDDAIIGKGLDRIITSWNKGAEKIFGFSADEMVGNSIMRLIPADRPDEENHILEKINCGESVEHFETLRQTKDGRLIDVSVTVSPIKDATGRVVGVSKVARDITERKRAEETLARERNLLRAMFDILPDYIYLKDEQSRFVVCNNRRSGDNATTATSNNLIGKTDADFFPPEQAARFRADELAVLGGKTLINKEETLVRPDGSQQVILTTKLPFRDSTGKIVGLVGYGRDITERKRAEEQIERLARFPSENPNAVLRVSARGVLEYANVAADTFLPTMGAEVGGTVNAAWQARIGETLAKKHPVNIELQAGNRTFGVTLAPVVAFGYVNLYASDITERKRMEKMLRESQALYHSLVDQLPAGIFRKDPEGRYVFVSSWFCRLKGMKAEEFLGKTAREVAGSEAAQQDATGRASKYAAHGADHHHLIMRTGKPIELVEEYATADGQKQFVHAIKFPVINPDGKLIGTQGILFDITERKRAEAALAAEQRLLNNLITATPDIIYFKDREGRFIRINEAFARRHGLSDPSAALRKTDFDIFGEQHAREAYADEKRIVATGQPMIDKEEREDWKDGHVTWASSTKMPMRDDTGKITGIMGISRDITERKQAEEKLKLFRLLIERSNDAIEVVDSATGRFLDANESGCRALGYTRDELLSLTVFDLTPEVNRALFDATNAQIKRAGHATLETLRRRKDGTTYPVEVSLSSVTLDREYTVAIVRDITERRKLEAQFRQSQKMEAVGQLAGGVAHDFNNILGVIIGYGDLIAEDLEPDSPLRQYAEEIRHAAVRATGLTRQLLVFSRKQKVQLVVLDLNDAVKNLDKMLRRLIGENIEMMVVPGKEIARIKADSGYIGQVLMNLAVNARDAMSNGGKLTIATNNVTLDENYTRTHTGTIPGDYVMLSVSDTGTGMTDEVKARMFEALFTTKPAGKGTGLGLATCQTIVQQSGGHIDVDSEVGKGTTFKIYFPRVDKLLEVAAGPIQTGPLPRGTETLLLVEDEASVRHLAWKVLEALGYHVLRANDGQDALHLAREHKGSPIRLVVTDVIMPRMGGKVMADWLKTTYPDIKVLFTSGYTDDAIAKQGVLEPGVAFLSKPYTPGTLARKVRAMLDNETDTSILRKQGVTINQSQ